MLRYLKIAVTVVWLTVCLLLIALWVRSYTWRDELIIFASRGMVSITSSSGSFFVAVVGGETGEALWWHVDTTYMENDRIGHNLQIHPLQFYVSPNREELLLLIAFWFPILLVATLRAVPWIKW